MLEALKKLHLISKHRGILTIYYNIKDIMYVLGIVSKIAQTINECTTCSRYKITNQRIPTRCTMYAGKEFERIYTDVFGHFVLNDFKTDGKREVWYIL